MSWEIVSSWIEAHPGLSSWVQAVGAIAAIAIAIVIPYRQRSQERRERATAKSELEISRTAQLLSIHSELEMIVSVLPHEYAGADYRLTNKMSRELFQDLIERLNYFQRDELSRERLGICLSLRFELYDWLKFFSEAVDHDGGVLFRKSEKQLGRISVIKQKIENVQRVLNGEKSLEIVKHQSSEDEPPPW